MLIKLGVRNLATNLLCFAKRLTDILLVLKLVKIDRLQIFYLRYFTYSTSLSFAVFSPFHLKPQDSREVRHCFSVHVG